MEISKILTIAFSIKTRTRTNYYATLKINIQQNLDEDLDFDDYAETNLN
jgi:hypothetical protein